MCGWDRPRVQRRLLGLHNALIRLARRRLRICTPYFSPDQTMADLLEAAAAYMAFVEGMDDFSRPQLMNTVRQGGAEDFSREEGLRSFGQLLRTGKLQKLEGGRFKASEQIGFQPDARAAG